MTAKDCVKYLLGDIFNAHQLSCHFVLSNHYDDLLRQLDIIEDSCREIRKLIKDYMSHTPN